MKNPAYSHRHFLGMEGLYPHEIEEFLDLADSYADRNRQPRYESNRLTGRTQVNLFMEASTRTRASFELAGLKMGANVINMTSAGSSICKGETLVDMAVTLNAMKLDILVVRHHDSGAAKLLSKHVQCAVVNAGDGLHEHPTQAIVDALTIRRNKGRLAGLEVAICGDIAHSRVARSNIHLLSTMGVNIRVVAPRPLLPSHIECMGVTPFTDMREGIRDADIIMMLRVQNERLGESCIPSAREYAHFFGLNRDKLALAKPDALVMHPGPINRGIEIDSDVADDLDRSLIRQQVEMSIAARMAILDILIRNAENNGL
ncbi:MULTISPECIES: aspartate carbamoyltransferase catalytic subunit [unclassified Haematospirillum]|uniref:aspartate carbamoyltransferase catalytic subunit n=1 Tax=unclassified Haematospirillum TaxID=2622088 RepID=UPI001439398E|nr:MULTISPECIES: aspartate carbamoyltransferase catalytic subunit [unclassified Haematospirillum]NKD54419.1 aspartate carbamoyltransferase catalytic subunit [Haematospirillum sp. H4890]NKD74462.1 aspartate carbamoyltransferase catalytic subunit [Haematospirillum sp. H4485]NKD86867.1 aspartate carbamoyltransferase catalytic subunit [Haematospirillum sp. 15-248]